MGKGKTISLSSIAISSFEHSFPFAFYRLPGSKFIKVIAQKSASLPKLRSKDNYANQKGFLFAPFYKSKKAYTVLIKPDIFLQTKITPPEVSLSKKIENKKSKADNLSITDKADYISLVEKIVKQIGQEKFIKVVAARVLRTSKPVTFDAELFFRAVCHKYPNSFVSLVYTPAFGLWIGASPEILLRHDGSAFKTYALAGTKSNVKGKSQRDFGKKEKMEQEIVTEFVSKAIRKVSKIPPVITGPTVIDTGNLLHLRTAFSFSKPTKTKWQKIVKELHPTPAVAGSPKKRALSFIKKHEKEDRDFYCGYLGPVNIDGEINLYVNLRCMKVLDSILKIYVGCGITEGSIALEEWNETLIKSQTLLSVLKSQEIG